MTIEREFVEAVARDEIREFASRRLGIATAPVSEWDILVKSAMAIVASHSPTDYPRCKTCKWWSVPEDDAYGECSSRKVERDIDNDEVFYPHPTFGCIHWEKREEKAAAAPSSTEQVETLKRELQMANERAEAYLQSGQRMADNWKSAWKKAEKLKAVAEAAVRLCADHKPDKTYFPQLETALKSAGYEV